MEEKSKTGMIVAIILLAVIVGVAIYVMMSGEDGAEQLQGYTQLDVTSETASYSITSPSFNLVCENGCPLKSDGSCPSEC